ncbi:S41 family peptidase [Rurimicrobium arvi]|uniref:S41 family peptidase n=1 Tax=Rurimicrobium arvi TaxID=2049916 RepID=A0ABP8MGI5_9BACT
MTEFKSHTRQFIWGTFTICCFGLFIQAKTTDSYFEMSKNLEVFANIFKELNTYYVDPIEPGKLTKTGIDAMLNDLDPYTNYITESDIEDYEFMTTGKYGGIGAALQKKEKDVYVGEIYENSPAQKAGLHSGDKIISIDGKNVYDKTIDDVSLLLKGSSGTKLVIKVKDAFSDVESDKVVTRGEIEISSVPYAGMIGASKDIAYVKLTQFTMNCSKLLRQSLDSLKKNNAGMKSVVLDLRGNPGGLLDEAVEVCNIFIDRGQLVVSTKGKNKEWDKNFNTEGSPWDTQIPVAVLVNGSSASASEIVAGTIQDLDRGVVIGTKSYGKGLVQATRPLGFNARLKLTTAKYYTPSGRCIQAIDYSHRDENGNPDKIADSLIGTFKTKNGRLVKSGGGVTPDVTAGTEKISALSGALYSKNYFFDYATQYARSHKTLNGGENFSLTAAEFADFSNWLSSKDYSYKTKTEILLDSLTAAAQQDKLYDASKTELAALKTKVMHDKKQDLLKNKEEVMRILENEIVSRYYFQKGRINQSLRNDEVVSKAVEVISRPDQVKSLLQAQK